MALIYVLGFFGAIVLIALALWGIVALIRVLAR
jgi:hypothetical protein